MQHLISFKGSPAKWGLQLLAACLLFSQSVLANQSCRVQIGVGRAFTANPLDLKVLIFNLKDDFIFESAQQRGDVKILKKNRKFKFKSESQLDRQREIIHEVDPDIFIGSEIHKDEDAKHLLDLDTNGLKGQYYTFVKQGNSDRGINIMFGVKKDLGFKFKLFTHKDREWTDPVSKIKYPLFSRDLPVLTLTRPGDEKPMVIIIGNHAKSKRDNPQDPESTRYRTAQYEEGVKVILEELQQTYGKDVPVIMGGDFNTDVIKAAEMNAIRDSLKSVFDSIKGKTFEYAQRATHFYFGPNGKKAQPMDDIRVAGQVTVLDAEVIKYKDANGNVLPDPANYADREKLPSDHRPVRAVIRVQPPM